MPATLSELIQTAQQLLDQMAQAPDVHGDLADLLEQHGAAQYLGGLMAHLESKLAAFRSALRIVERRAGEAAVHAMLLRHQVHPDVVHRLNFGSSPEVLGPGGEGRGEDRVALGDWSTLPEGHPAAGWMPSAEMYLHEGQPVLVLGHPDQAWYDRQQVVRLTTSWRDQQLAEKALPSGKGGKTRSGKGGTSKAGAGVGKTAAGGQGPAGKGQQRQQRQRQQAWQEPPRWEEGPFGRPGRDQGTAASASAVPDCWHVLGLPATSTLDEVKARYRALALQHHPDRFGSPEVFIRVQAAYEEALRRVRR